MPFGVSHVRGAMFRASSWRDVRLRVPSRTRRSIAWGAATLVSGLSFVFIFRHLAPVPESAYSYRDDAVITLSHAKNLVDYGSIGIDPAGARVEGFSAPLQFWIFALVYALTKCGFEAFLDAQVIVCNFLLGCAVLQLFRPRPLRGLLLSLATACWLTSCVRFFGWHQSGMENAYVHVLFVATLAAALLSLDHPDRTSTMLVCATLSMLARLDGVFHVAPLLLIWSVMYTCRHGGLKAWRVSGLALAVWGGYQVYRVAYFGDLQPNSARAQGIDVIAALHAMAHGTLVERDKVLSAVRSIAADHRVYFALAAIPLLALGKRSPRRTLVVLMLCSLGFTGLLHPLVFGPARLDPVRTTSHVALVAPLLIAASWAELGGTLTKTVSAALLVAVGFTYSRLAGPPNPNFCCVIARADRIADTCLAQAKAQDIKSPSLANPDLGRISFRKQFLLFDLGLLGSPPLAELRDDPRATADYLLDFAQPDFIELHGGWVCKYGYLLADARFRQRYEVLPAGSRLGLSTGCPGRAGIWFRKALAKGAPNRERAFHDALRRHFDPALIAAELDRCKQHSDPLGCVYVARTVYRFIPELVRSGSSAEVLALFRDSQSRLYDVSLLGARDHGAWYRHVVDFVRAH